MIHKDAMNRPIVIENADMSVALDYSSGFRIRSWQHHNIPGIAELPIEVFVVEIAGEYHKSNAFELERIEHDEDLTQELIAVYLRSGAIRSRLCLINDKAEQTMRLIIQIAVDWPSGIPQEVYLRIPFLTEFRLHDNEEPQFLFPGNPFPKKDGSGIMQQHRDFPLPLGILDQDKTNGFSVEFPTLNEPWVWSQNRNTDLNALRTLDQLHNHRILIRPNQVLTDIIELKFSAVTNGWVELFNQWRERVRTGLDLSEYQREELQWSKDVFLPHFTFAFGKEAFDYTSQCFDLDRLLEQGNSFGGYDAIILWHQYPRLGVDKRSQWDFFDDFPGGIQGLRETVNKAHQFGIKVYLPFKPWDVGYDESPQEATDCIKRLVAETDIDGIFLDTMESVPKSFRTAIDSVKKGVVFCSEIHPNRLPNIKLITESWDQYWGHTPMPEADLMRYVVPEHSTSMSSRFQVGVKKDMLIQRAIFNGTGIVIWQDVFGSWLPFSANQKQEIKKWKALWTANKPDFTGSKPIPLYPCLQDGLYCNLFPADDGHSAVYTFYNNNAADITGDLAMAAFPELRALINVWDQSVTDLCKHERNYIIQGKVPARSIVIFKATK